MKKKKENKELNHIVEEIRVYGWSIDDMREFIESKKREQEFQADCDFIMNDDYEFQSDDWQFNSEIVDNYEGDGNRTPEFNDNDVEDYMS